MKTLLSKAKQAAEEILLNLPKEYTYHTIDHTQLVVKAAGEISMESNLSTEDLENVLIAAWFHDTGYSNGGADDHEDRSVTLAQTFLNEQGVDLIRQYAIINAIMATRMPQQPQHNIDKILCDADLYSLSLPDFMSNSQKLREEWLNTKNKLFNDTEWIMNNLTFMEGHEYFTIYGRTVLAQGKKLNVQAIKKQLKLI
jgi:predicted metal-dependent HD superfamily phosphohydrolase